MARDDLLHLPVRELSVGLASGSILSVDLVAACCARIEAREEIIRAWAWFDKDWALQQAAELDKKRQSGAAIGPLHGLPVAVKDIIDTGGIPTENGCALDQGRVPTEDAWVVKRLKEAGAVIMGKTVTTELAFLTPSKTRNPHNPNHTPGGSSSGSAAAVADGMVPLALGTQTGGSIIRPASFCGIVGIKPQFDAIPKTGVMVQSHSLDTLGVFARDPEGAGLLLSALTDDASLLPASPDTKNETPRFGAILLPGWDRAEPSVHDGLAQIRSRLGDNVPAIDLPEHFNSAAEVRATLNAAEMAFHFQRYFDDDRGRLGTETRKEIEAGLEVSAQSYLACKAYQKQVALDAEDLFETCDVLICPAALGPAPHGLASTGDSIFNGVWTLTGQPALTLPLLSAPDGLPIGVQLVAPKGDHSGLLKAANWLWQRMGNT